MPTSATARRQLRVSVSGVTPTYEAVRNRTVPMGSFIDDARRERAAAGSQ